MKIPCAKCWTEPSRREFSSAIWRLANRNSLGNLPLPEDEYLSLTPSQAPMLLTTTCRRCCCGLAPAMAHAVVGLLYDLQHRAFWYDSWLKRSQGCPLTLGIACFGDLSELRSLFQPYAQQISSLTLDFFHCDNPSMIEDNHSLEELTIHKYN
jgi:hypothetical protein